MVRNQILIGIAALFAAAAGALLLGTTLDLASLAQAIPFLDPHSIPFLDPHSIPFLDPHAISF